MAMQNNSNGTKQFPPDIMEQLHSEQVVTQPTSIVIFCDLEI